MFQISPGYHHRSLRIPFASSLSDHFLESGWGWRVNAKIALKVIALANLIPCSLHVDTTVLVISGGKNVRVLNFFFFLTLLPSINFLSGGVNIRALFRILS